jgi:predicted permease
VLLSVIGGAFGLAFGVMGIRALLAVNTAGLPRIGQDGGGVALDWRVVTFTFVLSIVTGVVFGLIPALASSRADLTTTLKEAAGRSGSGGRQNRTRSILVVVEVALAMVLLIGSALLIRTAVALGHVDPGFNVDHVLTMRMSLTGDRFQTAMGVEQVIHSGLERLRATPGIVAASATCCVPLQGGYGLPFIIAGRALPEGQPFSGQGGWTTLSPGYFDVFKIPVKRGRVFDDRDRAGATPVVVINEAMAHQYWQNADPLADRIVIGRGVMREFAAETERQIIGVVGDTRDGGLNNDPQPTMYVPQAQLPDAANALNVRLTPMAWVVRTQGEPHAFSQAVQQTLKETVGLPVTDVRSMGEVVSLSTSRSRFNMWLMSVFGAAALLLASIGIYGLMAYSVEQRTQEIGIRLALGARIADVRRMVIVEGGRLALIGVVVGVGAAFALVHFISSITDLLFGVRPSDPLVFVGVPVLLMVVSLVSVALPALRASRVSPIIAMRTE